MKKLVCFILIASFGFLASGCATIVHGTTTRINIDSQPEGATVHVDNNTVVTPAEVTVRNNGNRTVQFSKDGYRSTMIYLDQQLSGWVWPNVFFGLLGLIGLCLDMSNGAAYKLSPNKINAVLESK